MAQQQNELGLDFLDVNKTEEELKQEREEKLRDWFLKSILRHVCTEKIARERLEAKCDDPDFAEKLMREARALRLLDDAGYALLFVGGHESWGRKRIMFELSRRGVAKKFIDEALASLNNKDGSDTEADRAHELAKPWFAAGLELRKIEARLQRRGFSSSAIRAACRGEHDVDW